MGMLMHHSLVEQLEKAESPKAKPAEETKKVLEEPEPEAQPVKKTAGRRKASK